LGSCKWPHPHAQTLQLLVCVPLAPVTVSHLCFSSQHFKSVERSLRKRAGDAETALAAAEQQVAAIAESLGTALQLRQVRSLTFAQELSSRSVCRYNASRLLS
jgi:hypothetical protein